MYTYIYSVYICVDIYTHCVYTHTLCCVWVSALHFLQKEQQRNSTKKVYLTCKLLFILQCISISMEGNLHSKSHTVEHANFGVHVFF